MMVMGIMLNAGNKNRHEGECVRRTTIEDLQDRLISWYVQGRAQESQVGCWEITWSRLLLTAPATNAGSV